MRDCESKQISRVAIGTAWAFLLLLTIPCGASAQTMLDNKWLCQVAPNPDMTYMLIPNSQFVTLGVPFTTNEFGFRDGPVYPKDSGTFRILCVGDSVTFGTGVKNEETFPNVLESVLSQYVAPNRRIDVVNGGISAYNIRNIRGLVQEYLDEIQPDLVIYTFVENDLDDSVSTGPGGILMALDPLKSPDEPFVSDDFPAVWLMRRSASGKSSFFNRLASVFSNPIETVSNTPPPLLLGDHFETRRRWANFKTNLAQMKQLCEAQGARLLVDSFAIRDHSEAVTERVVTICEELGLPHASSLPIFHQDSYMRDFSLGYDPHFNIRGHQLMADRLLCYLIDQQAFPADLFGRSLPHNHYSEPRNPEVVRQQLDMALSAPSVIDIEDEKGVLGILGGIDVEGKMARYAIFRLGGNGEQILVTATDLTGTPEQVQTLRLEVEGEAAGPAIRVPKKPTRFTFTLPQKYWNRPVEIRLVADGPVWVPPPPDRVKGATPQTVQIFRVERVRADVAMGS